MLAQDIIRKKRDKKALSVEEIDFFCKGIVSKRVGEGQIGSFCMAVLLNGMSIDERVALTMGMMNSGDVMDWSHAGLDGPVLDKHSTGGVGDKVSLMLAPMIAACGGYVPMISGRGLGHTGGTLDKMDSIPGYVSQPDMDTLRKVTKEVGCAVVGATSDIAPADRTMYAVRDVTSTVESIDLITASILSKKLAAGLDGLVLDVKFGSGAFMDTYEKAKALAQSLVNVANGAGLSCAALMTDMKEILGKTAGNAVEVREAIQFLRGENVDQRLYDVTVDLVARVLVLGNITNDIDDATKRAEESLSTGKAAEHFDRMVEALGGPKNIMESYDDHLRQAPETIEIYAKDQGYVTEIDTREVGMAVVEMGGGRRLTTDPVDHSVGLRGIASLGDQVDSGTPLMLVDYDPSRCDIDKIKTMIQNAFTISDTAPDKTPAVDALITASES